MNILKRLLGQSLVGGLAVVALGGAAWFVHHWRQAKAEHANPAETTPADIARKLSPNTISVPAEFDLKVEPAQSATRPRALPPFPGVLALDTNTLIPVRALFPGVVTALGTVNGKETKTVRGDETGVGRPLRYGDWVEQNQLLAVLTSKDLGEKKSELVDALSRLKLDQDALERYRDLTKGGIVPERTLREAERNVEMDLIALRKAANTLRAWGLDEKAITALQKEAEQVRKDDKDKKINLGEHFAKWARVEIRAREAGVILEKNTNLGDSIADTTAVLFKIGDTSRLTLWAHVYEADLPLIQELRQRHQGEPLPCRVSLTAQPGESFAGSIEQVGEVIDPNQHTALVVGAVDNSDHKLRIGQAIQVHLEFKPDPSEIELPMTALVEDGRNSFVFVQTDRNQRAFQRRPVDVARRYHDVVILRPARHDRSGGLRGVEKDELVVTNGAVLLNEAMADLPAQEKK